MSTGSKTASSKTTSAIAKSMPIVDAIEDSHAPTVDQPTIEAPESNPSYKVDLNIPMQCAGFKVVISNNVYTFECKSGLATRLIDHKITSKTIFADERRVVCETHFNKDEGYLFNHILNRSEIDIDELFIALQAANNYFEEYDVLSKSQVMIDKYIANIGRYNKTWHGLTSKPDYNLTLFRNRMLPYFHIECKDWVKANLDALRGDYPIQIIKASTNPLDKTADQKTDDYHEEMQLATRNNNFLEWSILSVDKYPNLNKLIERIKLLQALNMERQAMTMIYKLMLSPRECHIIGRPEIWEILKPKMVNRDIDELVRYCMYYAMYILRQEETIMFSQVDIKSRVLFKINDASKLPTFDKAHIERTPYIIQLTDTTPLGQCMPFYLHGKRRINTLEVFQRRFNIASGGAFKGVDLVSLGAAITGSILIPCVHTSPLEAGFEDSDFDRSREGIELSHPYMIDTPTDNADIAFANYLEYYYASYVSLNDRDFKEQVYGDVKKASTKQASTLPTSLPQVDEISYENEDAACTVDEKTVENKPIEKLVDIPVDNTHVLNPADAENKSQRLGVDYNQLADIDISITTRDHTVFKERALILYNAIVENCKHRGPVFIKEIKTIASIKYKIYGPGIPRPMDIFRIPYDPVKMVKKFHVNAVKMFYNGDVTMFRSCVSTLLSGVGENYKWFSCNKVPADVLLKYAQRGMSGIYNDKERDALSKYVVDSPRWGSMLKALQIDAKKIFCMVTNRHPFFRPGLYDGGVRMGLRNFERETHDIYPNTLVVNEPKIVFEYGRVLTHDMKNVYPPDHTIIDKILNHIESDEIEDDSVEV